MKAVTFKDRVRLYVTAGNGGDGSASFRREKFIPKGGPDGGDGGRGGDITLCASKDVDSLVALYFTPHQRAGHGGSGRGGQCSGKNGKSLDIPVPCGTVVFNADSGEKVGEVISDGETLRVARGGRGGLGNVHFKSSTHQAPREFTKGEKGEEFTLNLELKMVADVGLIGYPNAGKSTLLSKISRARPKIAAYPFTTLNPVIGTVELDDTRRIRVADIPGLIEGAHKGVGLGHDFLRHIERTRYLLFVIDMAGVDGRKPVEDYFSLRSEMRLYRPELDERPYFIVANKMDMPEAAENLAEFRLTAGENPIEVSAELGEGIDKVVEILKGCAVSEPPTSAGDPDAEA
ncbi:MAG: GTPase ObgE [Kiritimatiellae bacterium]|nr:GTPase ObgE [Kiritimatiellia bacterium]